jgi:hypothetical protein
MRTKKAHRKYRTAKSVKTANPSISSAIAEFKGAIDAQTEMMKNMFNGLKGMISRQKPLRASRPTGEKLSTNREASPQKEKINGDKFFLEALRQIGRPATTKEVAQRLRKIEPAVKKIARNREKYMQMLYTSASHLSKEGVVQRNPIGHRIFEYSLKDWGKKNAASGIQRKRKYHKRAA